MKKALFFACLTTMIAACTNEDIDSLNVSEDKSKDVVYSFDLSANLDAISSLDSLESTTIPVTVIGNVDFNSPSATRAGQITPIVGTVTNLGNQKTLFRYGVGENIVPQYYCGNNLNYMTISNVYKVSVRYELNDNYEVKGYTGDNTGWNGTYINNPQTRWQGKKGDTSYTEFYTFVYDIKSTLQGYSAGDHCWLPVNVSDVRIYTRIFE
ncbi:MAG: hypothetical protein WAR39_09340 [Prevotella sp.]